MHRNHIERIKDFSWRCGHGSKTHLLLVLYAKHPDVHPNSQDFVSTTLPTKRSQGSLESNQIHIVWQKNQKWAGTLRHHQEHERSPRWCDMDKWASLKDFISMKRCQVKRQKREKRILQKTTRTQWYSKTTNNMIYTRKVYFISLGNISWQCYPRLSNLDLLNFPEVKVSSKMLHKVF